jgi:hypothetical protein
MRFWPVDDLLRGDDRPAGHFSAYGRILYDVAVHPNGDLIAALSSDYGGILLFGVPAEE